MKILEYDIMPDNYFTGVSSARSGYGGNGTLVFHFNADNQTWQETKASADAKHYECVDMHSECPGLEANLVYRYALAIPMIPFMDQVQELHTLFRSTSA